MKSRQLFNLVLGLLLLLVLPACEDEVKNLRDLDFSPKLVVNSYISPQDTSLRVQLQTTQPSVGRNRQPEELRITNATVTLSDGITTVPLSYNPDNDQYETSAINLPILAGKTYFLKVTAPGGFKAEASCTVPSTDGITISDLNHTAKENEWDANTTVHELTYKWTDAPGAVNYYRSVAYLVVRQPNHNGTIQTMKNPFYLNDDELRGYFTDEGSSGKLMHSPRFYTSSYNGMSRPGTVEYEVHAMLVVADSPYFRYHKSVLEQSRIDGNPFAEPVFVYSNIQGGIGVFGAYNTIDTFITVK